MRFIELRTSISFADSGPRVRFFVSSTWWSMCRVQVKVQNEPHSQSPTQSQSQSLSQSLIQVQTLLGPANVAINNQPLTTNEVLNASSKASSPSKIPFRPRKVKKLSPQGPETKSTVAAPLDDHKPDSSARTTKNKFVPQRISVSAPLRIVARSLSCEGEIEIALCHLRTADPLLGPSIDIFIRVLLLIFFTPHFLPQPVTRSILYRQLAYKAGALIYNRFIALCGGEAGVLVFSLTSQQLRQIGVSSRKASYLHDLTKKYRCGLLSDYREVCNRI